MSEKSTIVRAFELAGAGTCRTIDDVQRQLKREGYSNVVSHLEGRTIRKQLKAAMQEQRLNQSA